MAGFPSISVNLILVSVAFAWVEPVTEEMDGEDAGLFLLATVVCGRNPLSLNFLCSFHTNAFFCGFHSQHLGQTFSPGVAGCAASMVMPSLEKSLRLGGESESLLLGQGTLSSPAFLSFERVVVFLL